MNQIQTESHSPAMKTFAVVGFIAVIIFAVWLAVQVVSLIPGAFSSLASIADSVYSNKPQSEIIVANENSIINDGESFTIRWTDVHRSGVYTFNYTCTEGVALDMRFPGNTITPVACNDTVTLGEDVVMLEIMAASAKQRFSDVVYTIGFTEKGADTSTFEKTTTFTVVNANIPQSQSVTTETIETDTESDEVMVGEIAGETTDTPNEFEIAVEAETPATPTVVTPPQPTAVEIYEIPTNDPDGFIDLAVRYLGVGRMDTDNNFISGGSIDNDSRGAFQFEVKNLGTKTSEDWEFVATLTSGNEYESDEQDGLKPNERSVITIGFDSVGDTGAKRFGAEIEVDNDINSNNDRFSWAVTVTE